MDIAKHFGKDKKKMNEGVKVPLSDDGTYHIVRHVASEKVTEVIKKLSDKEKEFWNSSDFDSPEGKKVLIKVIAKGGLAGWGGGFSVGGEPLEFSDENAMLLLSHEALGDYMIRVLTDMGSPGLFGLDDFKLNLKN